MERLFFVRKEYVHFWGIASLGGDIASLQLRERFEVAVAILEFVEH